jgi:iron complex transport system substrate-binding protein
MLDHNSGLEQIAAIQPDLVLMKTFEESRFLKGFEQLGIPIAFFDMETPEKFLKEISTLGKILGEEKQVVKITDFYDKWQKVVAEAVADIPEDKAKKTVLHLFYSDRGGAVSFNVAPDSWIQIQLIHMAGGKAIWKGTNPGGGWLVVGFDQIAAWDPDIVLVTSYFGDVVKAKSNLVQNNFWKLLKSVENNQMFAVPEDFLSWDQPDSRWILGLFWMATKLSPEAAKKLDGRFNEIYTEFYHLYGLREDQIADIKIKGDIF